MQTVEIVLPSPLPEPVAAADIPALIEQVCLAHPLTIALRTTLASYPGCAHWHLRQGKASGTLELTWWPKKHRLWFKVAKQRNGSWIDMCLPQLKAELEQAIQTNFYAH